MSFVNELKPRALWTHFDQILTIPRGSKNEQAICQYVSDVARRNNLDYIQDSIGNVIISKAASIGFENVPTTTLQCHLDMVNEKNSDTVHDFSQDPIVAERQGEYLTARGTTLGADNGIGIAASLAVLEDSSIQHGPLECLFTVDEETGLTGAQQLSSGLLKGKRLINLDSEEEGIIYIGCAGGADVKIMLPMQYRSAKTENQVLRIRLFGMKGGHSGIDIGLQRGNAVKLLTRILNSLSASFQFNICDFEGGNMRNAIPRESFAIVSLQEGDSQAFQSKAKDLFGQIAKEFKPTEPMMELTIDPADANGKCLTRESQESMLGLLLALPHGVVSMSREISELVETSSNLASVSTEDSIALIHVSNRSSVDSALRAQQELITAVAGLTEAETDVIDGYPGWQPDLNSDLLRITKKVYEQVLGDPPEAKAVHAGLECGIIKQKYPDLDMVSIGPQIEFPHSPDERVHIDSVDRFYRILTLLLAEITQSD